MVFSYITYLPYLMSLWTITVMPKIVINNWGFSPKESTTVAGYFYTSLFYGMIVSCLAWPYIIKFVSKKNSILLCVLFQGLSVFLMSFTTNI